MHIDNDVNEGETGQYAGYISKDSWVLLWRKASCGYGI